MDKKIDYYLDIISPYINKTAKTCSYCDYLEDLVLLRGKYTYITIAIGQFTEGYLQLCPVKHRTTAGCLKGEELKEFVKMQNIIRTAYKQCYGTYGIAFEHGKAGSCMWIEDEIAHNTNSLCHHAHRHFVPVDIDIRESIKKYIPTEVIINNIDELTINRDAMLEGAPYLYFENSNMIGYLYPVNDDEIPRQFLRTCVADKMGVSEKANRVKYPGVEFYEATKIKLAPVLNKIYNEII